MSSRTSLPIINPQSLRESTRRLHYRVVITSTVGAGLVMLYKWFEQIYSHSQMPRYESAFFWAALGFFSLTLWGITRPKHRRYIERGALVVAALTYFITYWLSFRYQLGLYPWQEEAIVSIAQWGIITYMIAFGLFRIKHALMIAFIILALALGIWIYFAHIYASYAALELSIHDFSNFLLISLQSIGLCIALRSITHIATKSRMMAALATKDSLTGLVNRLYLDTFFHGEIAKRKKAGIATSVAVCDIDHFKQVNDKYSHAVGDKVLQDFARILQDNIRPEDIAGRYGGEEFVLVFLNIPAAKAAALCETLRLAIEAHDWGRLAPNLHITASFGVSDTTEIGLLDSIVTLVHQADLKMYQAKKHGRNQVWV